MKFFVVFSTVFMTSLVCLAAYPTTQLVKAEVQKESGGNVNAIGDSVDKQGQPLPDSKWAYGPLQIHEDCIRDVNKKTGTKYHAKDCLGNLELSIWVYKTYVDMYATAERLGHEPTSEDMARIWNGGPNGWKSPNTLAYWNGTKKCRGVREYMED